MLMPAGMMVRVTVAFGAGLGSGRMRHSDPDHAARDDGKRDEQDYQPSPKGLHSIDASPVPRSGQGGVSPSLESRAVRERRR